MGPRVLWNSQAFRAEKQKEGVSKFWFILFFVLFFKTKPRLSQAGALSYHKSLDKDSAENDSVRIVDTIVDQLKLGNFRKLYRARGRSPYHPKMMPRQFFTVT